MAAYGPKQARADPGHAVEKAAAMDSVVFVVVRNVIGHNIGFWFGYLAGCLTPVFTDSAGFYSRYPSDQSASCGNFPQFLLCGCCFSNPCLCKNAALGRRPTARRLVGNRIQFSIQITMDLSVSCSPLMRSGRDFVDC